MSLKIKENSVFVADSHFNDKNPQLLSFLNLIVENKVKPSQLFLMGDIFDFISEESKYFIKKNIKIINLINKISKDIEIIYLEGNHDYNLKTLFPRVLVIKREQQPIYLEYKNNKIAISHGDIFTPWHYDLYCKIIRNKPLLLFLNSIDFFCFISKAIENSLLKKTICNEMKDFDTFAKKRLACYKDVNIVIEGHFHQGKQFFQNNRLYVNIPSLCCNKEYMIFDGEFKGKKL